MRPKITFHEGKINYDMDYHKNKFGSWIKNEALYNRKSEYAKKRYFGFTPINSKILEYGCGVGQNIAWHDESYGFEINKKLYKFLKSKGINTYRTEASIPDDYFDVIITCMVLEHLRDPIGTVQMLRKKLKDGGKLITVLPRLWAKIGERGGLNSTRDGHLFGWTFYEINYLLNYCGFKNVENKVLYLRGQDRFYWLPKFLYFPLITLLGWLLGDYDIMVVSEK
jgi:SAM-dependent methyltransferase